MDVVSSTEQLNSDVERDVVTTLGIAGNLLVRTDVENGTLSVATSMDEGQHVVAVRDQAGAITRYAYHALGRVRRGGAPHRADRPGIPPAFPRPSGGLGSRLGRILRSFEPDPPLPPHRS